MRALVLDIESSPSLAHVWSIWNTTVGTSQIREVGQVMSFASKWLGQAKVEFRSDFHDGHGPMIERAHALLDEADTVITYNGNAYDLKHLNREFLRAGLKPHSPVQSIDLYRAAKLKFKFVSHKLDFISRQLGLGGKVAHSGHELWVRCLERDPKAWDTMRRYNKGDVVLTEQVYLALLPWITGHPNVNLIDSRPTAACGRCGSGNIQWRGWRHTLTSSYRQFQCQQCGGWGSAVKREAGSETRGV